MVLYTDINPYIFLLGLAPLGILATTAIGIGGLALKGISALFNRESAESKAQKKALARLANVQAKVGKERGARETQLFDTAQPIIGQLIPQLQALLTGDRGELTKRFAPQLESLSGERAAAERRIQEGGPPSGATVQAGLELEKSQFAARNKLLSSAPAEAQAGLTQLLNLLLGASAAQGTAATSASSVAGAALEGGLTAERGTRALNASLLEALSEGAEEFGTIFAKPEVIEENPQG